MRTWKFVLGLLIVSGLGACTKAEPEVAPAKKEPPKSEQAEASNAAKPVPEPAAPAEVLDVVSKVAPAEVLDVVSKVAPADVGRKRILPKGRSLVKLRSLKKDVQVIMPEFGICIADLQKVGIARIPKLTLELHVDAAGKVTSAIIVETSQSIPEFEKCILNKARSLSLPEGEPDRVLRLPFAFGE